LGADAECPVGRRKHRDFERTEFVRDAHGSSIVHGLAFDAVMASPFLVRFQSEHRATARAGDRAIAPDRIKSVKSARAAARKEKRRG
jgi:hypothetical protein